MSLLPSLRLELWLGYLGFLDEVTFSSSLAIKWGTRIPLVLPLCRLVCLCPSSQPVHTTGLLYQIFIFSLCLLIISF